jgi:hypothetical protein
MIEFIFDNIAIVGFILYALIIFVSKIFSAGDADEKSQRRAVATPSRNKPIAHPQKYDLPKPQPYDFPKAEDTFFGSKKIEPIEDFEDDLFVDEPDIHSQHKLVEKMTADAHFLYGGNSHVPDESILQEEQDETSEQELENEFDDILKDKNALRKAFVASEILGKPKSMQ